MQYMTILADNGLARWHGTNISLSRVPNVGEYVSLDVYGEQLFEVFRVVHYNTGSTVANIYLK